MPSPEPMAIIRSCANVCLIIVSRLTAEPQVEAGDPGAIIRSIEVQLIDYLRMRFGSPSADPSRRSRGRVHHAAQSVSLMKQDDQRSLNGSPRDLRHRRACAPEPHDQPDRIPLTAATRSSPMDSQGLMGEGRSLGCRCRSIRMSRRSSSSGRPPHWSPERRSGAARIGDRPGGTGHDRSTAAPVA